MPVTVQIGPLTFYGDGTSTEWIYTNIPGWYSGAPIRGASDDLPLGDGASPVEKAYRSARTFKFRGALAADASTDAIGKWMQFAALQSNGAPFPFIVTDTRMTLKCMVSLNGAPEVVEINNNVAVVEASFIAYDPVKYGADRVVATGLPTAGGGLAYNLFDGGAGGFLNYGANGQLGRITLTNAGTAAVWPFLTVTGGLGTGFFVQRLDTGQVVRYDRVVPDGSTVSINFRTGEVMIDSLSDGSAYLTRYEFFSIAPGGSAEVQFNAISTSSGTPTATFTIADGYW